jgi:hypothetical protein
MNALLKPVTTIARRPTLNEPDRRLYMRSYLLMRTLVGALALALPVVLVVGDRYGFARKPAYGRGSLSIYYYAGMRDVFVGGLCATAVFLITYKVIEKNLDNTLSILAGFGALGVALFSTARPSKSFPLTRLQERLGETAVEVVHYTSAIVFIASLGLICIFFGIREGKRTPRTDKRPPTFWRLYHFGCAAVMVLASIFAVVCGRIGHPTNSLLIAETACVWAFGASWLMKGLELDVLL